MEVAAELYKVIKLYWIREPVIRIPLPVEGQVIDPMSAAIGTAKAIFNISTFAAEKDLSGNEDDYILIIDNKMEIMT